VQLKVAVASGNWATAKVHSLCTGRLGNRVAGRLQRCVDRAARRLVYVRGLAPTSFASGTILYPMVP
jgi:hypothetical protein